MKNVVKLILISALALVVVSCGNVNDSSDTEKETSSVSSISETDSSNESSETESFEVESSETDSSEDESSKAVTTTKTILKETAKATTTKTIYKETAKATTTTNQTTTQPAVTTKPYIAPTTTTQKPVVTTKPAVQTTKTTTKATAKQTTKATTKATQPATDLSKLSPYWRALYKMTAGTATKADYDTVRNEMLAYGKKLYPQFAVNTKLHPLITKNGKYTDSFTEAQGGTNSKTEYYTVVPFGTVGIKSNYASETARWNDIKAFDTNFKTVIKNTLQDSTRFDASQTVWYITYGFENYGNGTGYYSWVCMTAFPKHWK